MNILAVDDEKNILELYKAILSKAGYKVFMAENGEKALDIFFEKKIDLVIIDEMMPYMSGNEFIKAIREENQDIPIIMVTAKSSIDDKGKSFSLGVDDYIVKPISSEELLMRISALFRRAKIMQDKVIKVGNCILDSNTNSIANAKKNIKVTLTQKEFDILFKLLSYPEKCFSKWQLFDEFWGINSDVDENIVKAFIFKIRKQIEPFPEINIETVMNVGYRGIRNEK